MLGGVNTPCFVPPELDAKGDSVDVGLYLQSELGCDVFGSSCVMCGDYHPLKKKI